jgi:hypothetical protein
MSAWSMFFSFDVMGEVGFGKDFNNLTSGVEHSAIKGVHSHMTMLGIMSTVPWLLNVLGSIPGAAAGYSEFFSFCAGQIREKHKVSCYFQILTLSPRLIGHRPGTQRRCPKTSYPGSSKPSKSKTYPHRPARPLSKTTPAWSSSQEGKRPTPPYFSSPSNISQRNNRNDTGLRPLLPRRLPRQAKEAPTTAR